MKLITVIGARPQFIKAASVSQALLEYKYIQEIIIHTGQHFDANMSDIFFHQLQIPHPKYILDINGGHHGEMTGRMMIALEDVFIKEKPDAVMVYGDTNSTLAASLTAVKLNIPVIHIESGLRSFNMNMPEEINRILTDRISSVLFCPTDRAVNNLKNEGFAMHSPHSVIINVGDVMFDTCCLFQNMARRPDKIPAIENFILSTFHRAENTDNKNNLSSIIDSLNHIHENKMPVIVPLHPRTRKMIEKYQLNAKFHIIEPVGYLETLWLLLHCKLLMTDSGGMQKEAFFCGKPCITLRDETEWVELLDLGVNILVGSGRAKILQGLDEMIDKQIPSANTFYGGGQASRKIAAFIHSYKTKI
jgi:UDP-GlcNAc3NAcA epimerase